MREWTYIEETATDSDELEIKIKEEIIGELAQKWNLLSKSIERRHFLRDSLDYDDIEDHREQELEEVWQDAYDRAIESGACKEDAMNLAQEAKDKLDNKFNEEDNLPYKKLQVIEDLLQKLGARMMRPYEHWNEDERYMEYMENRYNDYEY